MQRTDIPWSEEEDAVLTELWAEGLSSAEIAKRFIGRSRNAVIGRVHRLDLPARATKVRAVVRKPKTRAPRRRANPTPPRNTHITRIKHVPKPEAKPNVFDASPASLAAAALFDATDAAQRRRDGYRGFR